jgi:hypothetical protein
VGVLFLVACAGEVKRAPSVPASVAPAPSGTVVVAREAPAPAPDAPAPQAVPDLSSCAMPVVAPPKDNDCAPFESRALAGVESELRRRFKPSSPQNKVVVDFGCNTVDDGEIRELVLERGSGHGGTLELTRLVRAGDRFLVRRIHWSEYYNRGMTLESSAVPAAALEPHFRRMGVALLAKLHEVPVYVEGTGLGLSGTSSSNDYHSGLTLIDDAGHELERHFSGYASDDPEELPMELATRALHAALAKAKFEASAATDTDRVFFAQRFLRMEKEREPFWWVEERFLGMATLLGSRPLVPSILGVAKKAGSDAVGERRKKEAIDALGAILALDAAKVAPGEILRKAEATCRR